MNIAVIGSGIIGLTTALSLQEAGHIVTIFTKQRHMHTTSAKVGAIWFPYYVEPLQKVNQWAGIAYHKFKEHVNIEESGIYMTPFLVLSAPGINNDWIQQLPIGSVRVAEKDELPSGFDLGWMAIVPLAEPPVYLPFLVAQFLKNGGKIIEQSFRSIEELTTLGAYVVNCTGLGAKELCNDGELYPVSGQILKVKSENLHSMVNSTEAGKLSYIIQRSDCAILGGTDYEDDYNETPSLEDTELIVSRLLALGVLPQSPEIIDTVVALRPKRSSIRCERDSKYPTIYHNYGHGGAGYTTAWGCAAEVAQNLF